MLQQNHCIFNTYLLTLRETALFVAPTPPDARRGRVNYCSRAGCSKPVKAATK